MLYDLLKSRRSIRKFQNKEVEKEKIDIILKSALMAPSSRSRRPWEFIAVTDKEKLESFQRSENTVQIFWQVLHWASLLWQIRKLAMYG